MVKKGTGKRGGSKYVSTLPPFDFQPPTIADLGYTPPEFIKCRYVHCRVASAWPWNVAAGATVHPCAPLGHLDC